jgi:hypothetical protein
VIRKVQWLKESKSFQAKSIQLHRQQVSFFDTQVDGEHHRIDNPILNVSLLEKSLCVLTAK